MSPSTAAFLAAEARRSWQLAEALDTPETWRSAAQAAREAREAAETAGLTVIAGASAEAERLAAERSRG